MKAIVDRIMERLDGIAFRDAMRRDVKTRYYRSHIGKLCLFAINIIGVAYLTMDRFQ